jgi:dihydroxy-acid dehydratase
VPERLIERDLRPREILGEKDFMNAVIVHAATGGSTNALLHLPAITHEAGLNIDGELFDETNKETRLMLPFPSSCWKEKIPRRP